MPRPKLVKIERSGKKVPKHLRKKRVPGEREKYLKAHGTEAFRLALLGHTDKDIARVFEVRPRTVRMWKEQYVDFATALTRGKDIADGKVANALYQLALGYKHKVQKAFMNPRTGTVVTKTVVEKFPPNATACIFWLKNRHAELWRDRASEAFKRGTVEDVAAELRQALKHAKEADGA